MLLVIVDLVLVNIALGLALSWRFNKPLQHTLVTSSGWYIVLTVVWLAVSLLFGSYGLRRAASLKSGATVGAVTSLTVALAYILIPYVTPPLPTSRSALLIFLGAMVGTITAWRAFYSLVLVRPGLRRRALVIGAGWAGQTIVRAIADHAPTEYEVVGFIDDRSELLGGAVRSLPVLGTHEGLATLVTLQGVSEVIIAIAQPDTMSAETFQAIMECHEQGVPVTHMHVLFEELTGRVPVEHAGRNLHVVLPIGGSSHVQATVKRLGDVLFGFVGLVITGILGPFVWLGQRLEGKGPVFYRQRRVGQGGKTFDLMKFRTMSLDAEANGPRWAQENDERVTRFGRILRRLHLDEIPQAINIMRGELSFIGPRPERPEFVKQLEQEIPFYRARHAVRPGITGWAQVNYRYASSVEDALTKLQYDLFYIKHRSWWLDILILVKTIGLVLTARGR